MESSHIKILNSMASVGGSVDSVISSDTTCMSSVSLCENDIPGSSLDGRNSVSPKMPRSGVQSQVLHALAIFMNSVYRTSCKQHVNDRMRQALFY